MKNVNADKENVSNFWKEEIADSFFFQIHRMKRAIFRRTNALMTEAGITLQLEQLPILMILRHKGLSQRELSDKTMRDKSSILRSITALEKKNLVEVVKDKIDKRKNIVSLTEEGFTMTKEIRSLMKRAEDEVMSVFSPKERIEALHIVRSYADKLETL
ncbi:DNA-binding MarR family transcriptional regulator [Flavobacterium nitrogenifigens]|uniref:DNA-binding MarR family transcriptional regulator n=2 Tax=Flavobacterium TaxID=237 RepID=A0A7W7IWF8_9FLAO|nr:MULTISPECIES: MarR family transcriptional regulator [Flavobacterium]MBB4801836.1 DNA-binding MarR family transcriptional regulator [Flavobacterium nitrogenifigens]MBB6386794.1 DNA-binding MarR family transcriptional regulator [Flavobacterium notoginsengisoli]